LKAPSKGINPGDDEVIKVVASCLYAEEAKLGMAGSEAAAHQYTGESFMNISSSGTLLINLNL